MQFKDTNFQLHIETKAMAMAKKHQLENRVFPLHAHQILQTNARPRIEDLRGDGAARDAQIRRLLQRIARRVSPL